MINEKMKDLGVEPSAIRQLFEYGKKRKAEIGEENVFDFSLGNPSVKSPDIVNETLIKLLTEKDPTLLHGYTSAMGDLGVRKSIVDYLNKTYGCDLNEKYLYMTVGAAASLTITLNAILIKGDSVIVIAPYFPEYKVFIEKAGGNLKVVNSSIDTFKPNLKELKENITSDVKAIIINYPNNPSGVVLNDSDMKELTDILKEKERLFNHNIYLISDEPYRELIYENIKYPFVTNYYDNSIVCYSFSKSLSIPGERIGYIAVSSKVKNKDELYFAICGAGRALGFVCAPAIFQYMIPYCIGVTSDITIYKKNRDILSETLTQYGYEVVKPDGAFYLFVKSLEPSATNFSQKAKEFELLLVPSDSFGVFGYVRISYCVSEKQIVSSLPKFKKLYESYQK